MNGKFESECHEYEIDLYPRIKYIQATHIKIGQHILQ